MMMNVWLNRMVLGEIFCFPCLNLELIFINGRISFSLKEMSTTYLRCRRPAWIINVEMYVKWNVFI